MKVMYPVLCSRISENGNKISLKGTLEIQVVVRGCERRGSTSRLVTKFLVGAEIDESPFLDESGPFFTTNNVCQLLLA